ncbi:MAG: hypothetical protein HQL95_06815 [Magnetococcales bacterium]|nr:hypothetical protein [Magnetococcales bacterium]
MQRQGSALLGLAEAIETRYRHSLKTLFNPERWGNQVTPVMVMTLMKSWMVHRCLMEVQQLLVTAHDTLIALAYMRAGNQTRGALPRLSMKAVSQSLDKGEKS